jgi:hypothetical protein
MTESALLQTLRITPISRQQIFDERAVFPAKNLGVIARRSAMLGWQKAVVAQRQHTARRNSYNWLSLISGIRFPVAWDPSS